MYFDKLYLPFYFLQKTLSNSPNKENKELVIIHFYGKYLSLRFVFLEKKSFMPIYFSFFDTVLTIHQLKLDGKLSVDVGWGGDALYGPQCCRSPGKPVLCEARI